MNIFAHIKSILQANLKLIGRIAALYCICFCSSANAQLKIAPIWCFGSNAGLDFRKNPPDTFTTPMITSEGSGGITNEKGELMFYTDGRYIYNKNHQVMPNGQGLTGSPSSSQSAIVLQHPSQKKLNQFYVFTVPEYAGNAGFCYSIVDMDEDNGLGDVVTKNVRLYGGVLSEQMQPAMHSNGLDYWIVIKGFQNTEMHSFLIDQAGVTLVKTATMGNSITNTIGCMRFNKLYNQFAITCYDYSGYVQICDFDNTTGTISNVMIIDGLYDPYGVAFSPNGKMLYVSHLLTQQVNQYDLSQYNKTDILASGYEVVGKGFAYGQLSYASDGELYMSVTGEKYIARINDPDVKGSGCNFQLNAVSLGRNTCVYGLPLFYEYKIEKGLKITKSGTCKSDTFRFEGKGMEPADILRWQLDTGRGYFNVSRDSVFSYYFENSGNYKVKFSASGRTNELSFEVESCDICKRKIPNVFTPNGDGYNEKFGMASDCPEQDFNLSIYNRWGEKLFQTDQSGEHWDGTYKSLECSAGVYFYLISYTDSDGQQISLNGVVTLIH